MLESFTSRYYYFHVSLFRLVMLLNVTIIQRWCWLLPYHAVALPTTGAVIMRA
ncbi:uncharacterized protein K452DRAFT_290968 [Aplosporella prunicola CBS 121167]|uniref:Uncharacterized protein n=1 Tax=Aplosporella prunicola CBS 121167 TaxID=1176127 RepID=A0A6A6B2V5_9PEZI|nr:uncharacterized protein K452DRAFT_290968 [Aplosporella prunicola CBS 121167]KAF2138380.1 hypothetical protein K452DRAFT_290968 [Aplosporella prunicola CBS 121167]